MKIEKHYIYSISFTVLNLKIDVSPIIKIYFKYSFISKLKFTKVFIAMSILKLIITLTFYREICYMIFVKINTCGCNTYRPQ